MPEFEATPTQLIQAAIGRLEAEIATMKEVLTREGEGLDAAFYEAKERRKQSKWRRPRRPRALVNKS